MHDSERSSHTFVRVAQRDADSLAAEIERVAQMPQDASVVVGGMLTRVRAVVAKSGKSAGQRMAMFTLSDQVAAIEGVCFAGTFATHGELMQKDGLYASLWNRQRQAEAARETLARALEEEKRLNDSRYQDQLARAIFNGIRRSVSKN